MFRFCGMHKKIIRKSLVSVEVEIAGTTKDMVVLPGTFTQNHQQTAAMCWFTACSLPAKLNSHEDTGSH